jgi:hypothetical protein
MSDGQVDEVRSFNWTVTQRVGALNDRFLARDRPLGPSRLLWEIGERLVTTAVTEIRTVDPTDRDARQCIRAYFAELDRRSESGFDPSAGISADPHELIPPAGAFLIAYLRGEPAGCGAVKHHPGAPSELKRMWVAESARGLGIAGGSSPNWKRAQYATGPRWRDWKRTAPSSKPSLCTARRGTSRYPRSTTSPSRITGSKSASGDARQRRRHRGGRATHPGVRERRSVNVSKTCGSGRGSAGVGTAVR